MTIVKHEEKAKVGSIVNDMKKSTVQFTELDIGRITLVGGFANAGGLVQPVNGQWNQQVPNARLFIINEEQETDITTWLVENFHAMQSTATEDNFPSHESRNYFFHLFGAHGFLPFQSRIYVKHCTNSDDNGKARAEHVFIAVVRDVELCSVFWKQYLEFVGKRLNTGVTSQMLRHLSDMFEVGVNNKK